MRRLRRERAGGPAVVGSFRPNAFGLYDTSGNAAEWVEDCWNPSYRGAPNDGSAWMSGDCSLHVLRGGSFADKAVSGGLFVRGFAMTKMFAIMPTGSGSRET